jgi:HSP20 family protein
MTLIRVNPFFELDKIAKRFEQIKDNFDKSNDNEIAYSMRTDISENKNTLYLTMELPGVTKNDINISIDNERKMTIKCSKRKPESLDNKTIIRNETKYGNFERSFVLANDLEENKINAKFENGILIIEIPKKQEIENEYEIKIN